MDEGEDVGRPDDIRDDENDEDHEQYAENAAAGLEVVEFAVDARQLGVGQAVEAGFHPLGADAPFLQLCAGVLTVKKLLQPLVDDGEAVSINSMVGMWDPNRSFLSVPLADWSQRERSQQEVQQGDGIRSPGRKVPASIKFVISSATCSYSLAVCFFIVLISCHQIPDNAPIQWHANRYT